MLTASDSEIESAITKTAKTLGRPVAGWKKNQSGHYGWWMQELDKEGVRFARVQKLLIFIIYLAATPHRYS